MIRDPSDATVVPSPAGTYRLYTLGGMRLEGVERVFGSPRKALALLVFLARRAPRPVRREELAVLLWGERAEARARQSLRQVLLELRHVLGNALEVGPDTVRLDTAHLEVDVATFEQDVAAGRFDVAVQRWQGDFLAGAEGTGGESFRVWLEQEREALRRLLAGAFERLVEHATRTRAWAVAARWAGDWLRHFPYDERALGQLVAALDAAGQREAALAQHAAFLVRLRRDLEVEPSAELVRLGERLAASSGDWTAVGAAGALVALSAACRRVRTGDAAVALLRGGTADQRTALLAELARECAGSGDAVRLHAVASAASSWATARLLLAPLRLAPGLSGAPDEALGVVAELVPGIRERFPRLPAGSDSAAAIAAATVQVVRDVAAEVPVVVTVDALHAADAPSRELLLALAAEELPGVMLALCADDDFDWPDFSRPGVQRLQLAAPSTPAEAGSDPMPPEAAATPDHRPRGSRIPKRRVILAVAAPLLLASLAGAVLRLRAAPSVPPPSNRVAVFPFTLHGGGGHEHLREGLAELLAANVDGIGDWRAVDTRSVLRQASAGGTPGPRQAGALAQKLGAELVVLGSIAAAGPLLRVHAGLYRTNDEQPLVRAVAEGPADNLFALVDALTRQILGQDDDGPGGRFARVAALTTDSLGALKAYLDGESLLRRFLVTDAALAFRRAVAIDSTFALAWYGYAMAATWILAPDPALHASAAAARHAGRLGPRDRAAVETFHAYLAGRPEDAELSARSVLAQYPDDVELRMHLAESLFHFGWRRGRARAEAEPELRHVLRIEPRHWAAKLHLAQLAMMAGRRAEADSLFSALIAGSSDQPTAAWLATLRAAARADDQEVGAQLHALHRAGDWWLTNATWDLAIFAPDNLRSAERGALLLADSARAPSARALGHVARAHLELARGRWHNARAELALLEPLNRAWYHEYAALLAAAPFLPAAPEHDAVYADLLMWPADSVPLPVRPPDPQPWSTVHDRRHGLLRLYLLGTLAVRLGRTEDAAAWAAALDARAAEDSALAHGLAAGIRARLLRREGRHRDALRLLESSVIAAPYEYAMASPFWSQAHERYLRAELLVEVGRPLQALPLLRAFSDNSLLDAPFRAPAARLSGEIMEQQGDAQSAIAHYQRFIRLWQDADPELKPLVVAAQRRIERLQRTPAGLARN